MEFAQQQAAPVRRIVGLGVVLLLHALVVYALLTGLSHRVVEVIRAPVQVRVIEEVKKAPPPPAIIVPPPPKFEVPPPPFIPPPEIRIAVPPPPASTVTAVTPTPTAPPAPVVPVVIAPAPAPAPVLAPPAPPPPPVPAPAAAPAAPPAQIGIVCPTMVKPDIPRRALREGLSGYVKARATIRSGKVIRVDILESRPRGVYDDAVRSAMSQYVCSTGSQDVVAEQEFDFKIN